MQAVESHTLDAIAQAQASTLPGLFEERCRRSPDAEAYRQFDPASGWQARTWSDTHSLVARWRGALAREQLPPGERVAVMLRNCIEWVCYDQAAQSLGLVVVPLYPTDNAENIAYILADCGARVLLVGTFDAWRMLMPLSERIPQLARVLCLEAPPQGSAGASDVTHVAAWLQQPPVDPPSYVADPARLATIVYTSGTTGRPKGVMLSHRNILTNVYSVLQRVECYRDDVFLSFLPLSHTMERTCGYYLAVVAGSCVAFARSVQDLPEDLTTVQPTVLISVPRVYERVYAKLQQSLEEKGAPAKALFAWAEEIGWHRFEAAQHRATEPGAVASLMWPVLRHLVADKLQARLGGRLRLAVSGGAPVSARLMHCFLGLGLPVLQGYGLTETSPIVSANTLEDNVPESVGRPIPGVEVRLGDRDEILVRGPNVMLGYWNDEAKTRETFDAEGWLRTGDVGRLDARGHLYIVGRLKEILVTSTGEKIPPADVELAITEDPLFDQVMVLGEGRPFVSALAVLNPEGWHRFAGDHGFNPDAADVLQLPQVKQAVLQRIEPRVARFPSYARVRDVWLTLDPWTTDKGLITPTMKLRRRQLEQRFAAQISQLYERHAVAH